MSQMHNTKNITVSLTMHLVKHLKDEGWDIYWNTSGETDTQTAGLPEAKGTITISKSVPANPQYITRLKSGETHSDLDEFHVAVPLAALKVIGHPRRPRLVGLGHTDYRWSREFRIDMLASDEHEWRDLADELFEWGADGEKEWLIYDYETNPANPPELEKVFKLWADVSTTEIVGTHEEARYYIRLAAAFEYFA